jgi:hypothetical protein
VQLSYQLFVFVLEPPKRNTLLAILGFTTFFISKFNKKTDQQKYGLFLAKHGRFFWRGRPARPAMARFVKSRTMSCRWRAGTLFAQTVPVDRKNLAKFS